MIKAIDLLRQGRSEELWEMCCGYLKLSLEQFMFIQKRLLLEQINLLNKSPSGKMILSGKPETVNDFRNMVPLTTYVDYPGLLAKNDAILPAKTAYWVHTSGKSSEYACKWVPITDSYADELSKISYGLWMLSCCSEWGDVSQLLECPKVVYTVAPPPYFSGTLADMVLLQSPGEYLPSLEQSKSLPFDARIKLAFEEALYKGFDCFFGLSVVLAMVGDEFSRSIQIMDVMGMWKRPQAIVRLTKGIIKSKRAKRKMLPKDLWNVKGIISGGLDSAVYREKINKLWGRYPLDVYASSEGGIVATQTWDYGSMTFIPTLNFLEFIPEEEHFKWSQDKNYQPKTILLDEVKKDNVYEIVITNFHGGSLVRYRMGDMVRITSLNNENLGINIPQMVFERRADDVIDLICVRLTEKSIWQAIEDTMIPYEDWVAYKEPGELVLNILLEPKKGSHINQEDIEKLIAERLIMSDIAKDKNIVSIRDDLANMLDFKVKLMLLPYGTFSNYLQERQLEGADLAHLKPPHINPSDKILSMLRLKTKIAEPSIIKEKIRV